MMKTGALFLLSCVSLVAGQGCRDNGYSADPSQCDAYTQCKDGVQTSELCPEGLVFNDKLTSYPRYPCSYPGEVDCGGRTRLQPAKPTGECPHQYGMFRAGGGAECGSFLNCVAGVGHPHACPEGLAFNQDTSRCDWPDEVQGCDGASFLRFNCPGFRAEDGDTSHGHPRYSDPSDCRKFYVCVEGTKPRMHSCAVGTVFNPELGVCDEPQNVGNCANYYPKEILNAIQALKSYDNKLL